MREINARRVSDVTLKLSHEKEREREEMKKKFVSQITPGLIKRV
jgi:hypothetical protein